MVLRRYWNEPSDVHRTLRDLKSGIRPVPFSSTSFGSASERQPIGVEILQRGGLTALQDFCVDAPRSVLAALKNSVVTVQNAVRTVEDGPAIRRHPALEAAE